MTAHDWLADRLTHIAATRLRRSHPDWAQAILNEHASIAGEKERLGWAFGVLRASLAVPSHDLFYPAALTLAVSLMVLYQWSADEGVATLMVLGCLGGCLGFLRPKHFLLSGFAIGLVVSAVNGFEWLSGIHPEYETTPRTLWICLHWLIFIVPGLVSSIAGRRVRLKLLA